MLLQGIGCLESQAASLLQPSYYHLGFGVRNISMNNGLPTNAVRSIVQDKRGFMWLGTDNGLCRYDGSQVQRFVNPVQKFDQFISTLWVTDDGLVVGMSNGAYLFSFRTLSFSKIMGGQVSSQVNNFSQDGDGNIWMSTKGQGVFRYNLRTHSVKRFPMPNWNGEVTMVFVDGNNQVFALSNKAGTVPCRLNKVKDQFEHFIKRGLEFELTGLSMAQTQDGSLLVGTWNNGIMLLESDGSVRQLLNPVTSGVGYHIHKIVSYGEHDVYVACDDGLFVFNLRDCSWKMLSDVHNPERSIAERFVYDIALDREGGLWIGTFYGGVSYFSPIGERFQAYMPGSSEGFLGNVVSRFAEDGKQRVWIATDDGGLNCYVPALGKCVDYPGRDLLSRYNVHGLLVDGSYLWIGTYGSGLVRYNLDSGEMQFYQFENRSANSSCYCLFKDSKGILWATSMDGAYVLDAKTEKFKSVKTFLSLTIDIKEDQKGNVWFATQGGGLWCYAASASRGKAAWKQYRHVEGDSTSLAGDGVNSICRTQSGQLYIATDHGVCEYNAKKDCFRTLPFASDVHDFACVIENQDELWITSNRGILRYVPGEPIQQFNRSDGLTSDQFQPNAGIMASDGKIYFGTTRGFNTFYPYQIKINQVAPPVFITSVELFNKVVEVGSKNLPEALDYVEQVNLAYGDEMFSIDFAALSYVSPEKNKYAYRLEGFDKDWVYVGNEHRATYTNLPAGTYTFRVKATNNDGVWSKQEARLKIVIHPPFWWSLPAKVLYLLLIGYLIYLFTHMRLRKEKRRHQREMQQLSDKKEKEMKDARLQFFTMIAHEIRTPVSLIIGPLESLKTDWAKVSSEVKGAAAMTTSLDVIDRNAQRLLNLVNQLLDFNKVQQRGLQVHFKLCNMSKLMHAVAERFVPTLEQNGAKLEVEYPADAFAAVMDPEAITKVISNLMTNATKYTKDYVRLSCHVQDNDHFVIEVEDNGVGISPDEQKKIFSAFYQARDNKPGTGIGLNIVKNLVSAHHGKVEVSSVVGKGSLFTVTLPIHQADFAVEEENKTVDDQVQDVDEALDVMAQEGWEGDSEEEAPVNPVMLIVEDDEDMRNFIASNFSNYYQVVTAENGVEGLKMLDTYMVSLIVSDWMMPEMDGAEFCRHVRNNTATSHIPFIMLTAKTDNDSKAESMNCGADAFIEKPFSMKYLEACIRNLIDMRRLLQSKFSHMPLEPIDNVTSNLVDNEFLVKMNKLIEDNLTNPCLSVVFLAEQLNISRSTLFAKVKALIDVTPNDMIRLVKLKKAAALLKEGNYRVSEVCYMVGFSSPSYFTKCFLKQFGIRPGEFLEQKEQ